jgi:hypothetical protein
MIAFLATKLIGLGIGEKFARPLIWAALIAAVLLLGKCAVDRFEDNAVEKGRLKAVNAGNETTLTQIGEANDAANEIRNDAGSARFCECLRSATPATAGNCQRYIAHIPVPDRPRDPGKLCPR